MDDRMLEKARRFVFEKIGRNVCNLQKVEGLMKFLVVASTSLHGTTDELKPKLRALEESLVKKSMGLVAKDMFQCVFGEQEGIEAPDNPEVAWMSFKFSIELKNETVDALEKALSNVIEERNYLIHHDVSKYDLESIEGCRKATERLELQSKRIKSMHAKLLSLARSTAETRKAVAEFMGTEDFLTCFLGVRAEESDVTPSN